ncbi:MAG TPA: DoxX family protein [Thermoanaerobaculia bacterium]
MYTVIGRFAPQAFAIMRIVIGVLWALHGVQILFGVPPMKGMSGPLPPIVLAAGVIELVGGLLVSIGLATGITAFIASGTMAVAYFAGHLGPAMSKGTPFGWHPITNQGELAIVYCFIFLFIAAHGAGGWSIDSVIRGRRAVTAPTTS